MSKSGPVIFHLRGFFLMHSPSQGIRTLHQLSKMKTEVFIKRSGKASPEGKKWKVIPILDGSFIEVNINCFILTKLPFHN